MEVRNEVGVGNLWPEDQQSSLAPSKQLKTSPVAVDTNSVTQRLQKELMALMMSGGDLGVSAFPEGENIFTWIGTIEGGKGTMYDGLSYKLALRFPVDYPFKPPHVKFETMCFHPNVDQYGNICLDILQNPILKVLSTAQLLHSGRIRKDNLFLPSNSNSVELDYEFPNEPHFGFPDHEKNKLLDTRSTTQNIIERWSTNIT